MIALLAVLVLVVVLSGVERGRRGVREARGYGPPPRYVRRHDGPFDFEALGPWPD